MSDPYFGTLNTPSGKTVESAAVTRLNPNSWWDMTIRLHVGMFLMKLAAHVMGLYIQTNDSEINEILR